MTKHDAHTNDVPHVAAGARTGIAIFLASVFFAGAGAFAEEGEAFIGGLTPSGYVTGSVWATPRSDEKVSTAGLRSLIAFSGYLGDNADFRIAGEVCANGAGLAEAGDPESDMYAPAAWNVSLADRADVDLALKEAWIAAYLGDFDITVGQQIVTWGQADGSNPTDNVNPRYVGTRDASGSDEKKIATPMLNAVWNIPSGAGSVQALFMPFPAVNRMPGMGSFVAVDRPDIAAENFEVGARGIFYLAQASFSASWLTVLDRYPSDVTEMKRVQVSPFPPPGIFVDMPATLGYTRRQIIGFDAAAFLGSIDLRTEWAYVLTADGDGSDPYAKNSYASGVVQASKSFFDSALTASLSWSPTWIQDFKDIPESVLKSPSVRLYTGQGYELEQAVAVRLQAKLFGETLQPDAMFLTELAAKDWLATAGVGYNIADGWNLKSGLTLHGSFRDSGDPERELGVFGSESAIDSDSVYIELRYDF